MSISIALPRLRAGAVGLLMLAALAVPESASAQRLAKPSSTPGIAIGAAAPELDLPLMGGGQMKLSGLRGRPVVITFWGTWCPPCREEFPELVSAHRQYRAQDLAIVAVNQRDQELNTKDVQVFAAQYEVGFDVALDGRGRSRRSYRLTALPTTVFVDSGGVVRTFHSGPISAGELARGLATILPGLRPDDSAGRPRLGAGEAHPAQ